MATIAVDQVQRPDEEFDVLGFHEYGPSPEEIVEARHFVGEVLAANGVAPDLIGEAELVVDEFAINAVNHAHSFFSVLIEHGDAGFRVSVRDDSDQVPAIANHVALSDAGRGLGIVERTALQWGTVPLGHGKEVWAVLRRAD
jgi:anti-sigma regulatory factor (Ser/Thr protein kinase)